MVKPSKQSKKFAAKAAKNSHSKPSKPSKKPRAEIKRNERRHGHDRAPETNQGENVDKDNDFLGDSNLGDLNLEDFLSAIAKDGELLQEDSEDEMKPTTAPLSSDEDEDPMDDDDDDSGDDDVMGAEKRMRNEMKKLAEKDPDFHKYLREHESTLLDFDVDEDDDDGDESMGQEDMNDQIAESPEKMDLVHANMKQTRLTAKVLSYYEQGAFRDHGIKSLKKIVSAYKSACHLSDAHVSDDDKGSSKYIEFDSPLISNRVMVLCLENCHLEFFHHLLSHETSNDGKQQDEEMMKAAIDPNNPINPRVLSKSPRWFEIQPIINAFFKATVHWISEAKNPSLLSFVLKSLNHYIPYLSDFPRLASLCLKRFGVLWSDSDDASVDYQSVRLNAFLRIRQLAITQPFPFIETCLKSCYLVRPFVIVNMFFRWHFYLSDILFFSLAIC